MINDIDRPDALKSGTPARLIPVEKDGSPERRIISSLLACVMSVEEFGRKLLEGVGAPITKRSKIMCYTEIVFKDKLLPKVSDDRPDGLIVVRTGKKKWSAIVEAKIHNKELGSEQIERYIDIAKNHSVDAIITVSNQFATIPTHHPVSISKRSLRSINLYHWSWTHILTEAILLVENKSVSDPDQAYILAELVRFLRHSNSGVLRFSHMGSNWRDVCSSFRYETQLDKNSLEVESVVSSWHQLSRNIALHLSEILSVPVDQGLPKIHRNNPLVRLQDDSTLLAENGWLEGIFEIPNAASRLSFKADLKRRILSTSMTLKAPGDRKRSQSSVNWFIKQVLPCVDDELFIRVRWSGRAKDTTAKLGEIREGYDSCIFRRN